MKKVLLIFDLPHTLLYVNKSSRITTFDYTSQLPKKADCVIANQNVYFRTSRNELLEYLFLKSDGFFEVAVWSSLDKEKT
jgi:hypothetical protein